LSSQLAALVIALPAGLAIAIFFWSIDRVSRERAKAPAVTRAPRATPRELVERLLRPAAESLSLRRSVQGKPTLAEDLGRAGLNITPAEYLLIRIGATALGACSGPLRVVTCRYPAPRLIVGCRVVCGRARPQRPVCAGQRPVTISSSSNCGRAGRGQLRTYSEVLLSRPSQTVRALNL